MSSTSAEQLRHSLSTAHRSGRGRPYPLALRRTVVAFAGQQRARGQSVAQIAEAVGLSAITLARWLEPGPPSSTVALFRPVTLVAEPTSETRSSAASLVVHGPRGLRIEGLDLDALTHLLRSLT